MHPGRARGTVAAICGVLVLMVVSTGLVSGEAPDVAPIVFEPAPWRCIGDGWYSVPMSCNSDDTLVAIRIASAEHGVSAVLLTCLSWAESRHWPHTVSPTNDVGAFQFHHNGRTSQRELQALWPDVPPGKIDILDDGPWAGQDVYDPLVSARAAAWWIARNGIGRWTTAASCR